MKNSAIAAVALALCTAAFQGCSSSHKSSDESNAVATVDVARPVLDSVVLSKTYPGRLGANMKVNLVARVNGTLIAKHVKGGTFVKKGTPLFSIESSQYADAVKQAKAQLENARASYAYAQQHYDAVNKAFQSDAVSKMEVIQSKSNLDQSEAAISSAEAALRTAQTNLGYCTISAPFDGVVTDATVDVGAYLAGAGSPVTLATIVDESSFTAIFSIEDSRYLTILANKGEGLGMDFSQMPIGFGQKLPHDYTADLTYTSPIIDSSTGTMVLKAKVQNPYGELKDGMYVTVDLPYGKMNNAVLVQDAAISTDQRGKYIYTVSDSAKVEYTPIIVGETVGDSMRVVLSGLSPDAAYVTKAIMKVRPGMKVNPVFTNK